MFTGIPMISLGAWGGSGGIPWSSKTTTPTGIKEIIINKDDNNIKAFSFIDGGGFFSGTFGGRNPSDWGEEEKIVIKNGLLEHLMSISGRYGEYNGEEVILSISFITNVATYGPFGNTSNGQPFTIPIADCAVVGFYGRSGSYLNAIGIHVQPAGGALTAGPWGGSGGDAFQFSAHHSYIKQITLSQGRNIGSISFKDAEDQEYGPFGGLDPNDTGVEQTIHIEDSQRLRSISGTYGTYNGLMVITSLSFILNDGTIHGPYGTATGTSFSIPIQRGEISGFFGKSGYYLDSIGLYVKSE